MLQKAVVACAFFLSAAGECSMVIEDIKSDMGKSSSSLSNSNESYQYGASTRALSSDITQFNSQQQSKSVEITNKDMFLKLDESAMKDISELKFAGIELDEDILDHACRIIDGEFRTIEFVNCKLENGVNFCEILDSCNVENLSIKNCSITKEDLSEVLLRINPYLIKTLDISNNHLGTDVVPILKNRMSDRLGLRSVNVSGNDLDSNIIPEILDFCCKKLEK